ncbi:MAG: peptidoglycan-binding domain-containing protein [Candidatus Omnitrophota bacterium]
MIFRLLLGIVFLGVITGCATTGAKNSQEQLQTRVSELEKKVEQKDSEIVDLQYQVKDLSGKVTTKEFSDTSAENIASSDSNSSSKASSKKVSLDEIIRVNASIDDIQTALKNAGVYTGKIDGKIGAGTKSAIVEFQKAHHLTSDGVLGRKTWKLLKSYLKE